MMEKFGVEKTNTIPASLKVPTLSKADKSQTPEEKEEMLNLPYREAVGALVWTATMTRSDMACVVRAVARSCEDLGLAHKKAVLKVL